MEINSVKIINNSSNSDSGGYMENGSGVANMINATMSKNSASSGSATGGIIKNNSATNNGGGLQEGSSNTYIYKSGVVYRNTPSNSYETHTTCPVS